MAKATAEKAERERQKAAAQEKAKAEALLVLQQRAAAAAAPARRRCPTPAATTRRDLPRPRQQAIFGNYPQMAATIAAKPSPFHPTNYLGVDLLLSNSTGTGYAGVYFDGSAVPKPYYARFDHAGGSKYLGHFETPALAAVAYAKHGLRRSQSEGVWKSRRMRSLPRWPPPP